MSVILFSVAAMGTADFADAAGETLPPCPDSPNCVSSQAADAVHRIDPIAFEGSAEAALTRLKRAIAGFPRTRIVHEDARRLRVEFTSLVFRFVDDLDLYVDGNAGVIHVRSASRLGRYDFGVNRRRVEMLRKRFGAVTVPAKDDARS
jgi:uncharacterized protein (DUF1499 family)